jgi:hypothetical protein
VQLAQSVDRVTHSTPVNFQRTNSPSGFVGSSQPEHLHPLGGGGIRPGFLERLNSGWREPDFV